MKDKIVLNGEGLKIRKVFGCDNSSPIDIFSIVENSENYTITYYPMSDRLSGMCRKIGDDNLIFINSNMTYGRQRFTLAHELYHLNVEKKFGSKVCEKSFNSSNVSEVEANKFASYLLMPHEALFSFIERFNNKENYELEDVIKIEQNFQISHKATLKRLKEDSIISEKNFIELVNSIKSIKTVASEMGYSTMLYEKCEGIAKTYGAYINKAKEIFPDSISERRYKEILLEGFREDLLSIKEEENFNYD